MISPATFYRRAAAMPLVVPLVCAVGYGLAFLRRVDFAGADFIGQLMGFLVIAGAVAAIPYVLFMGFVMFRLKPATEAEFRRLSWEGPGWVSFIATVIAFVVTLFRAGFDHALMVACLLALLGPLTGYAYALGINGALCCAKRRGLVGGDPA